MKESRKTFPVFSSARRKPISSLPRGGNAAFPLTEFLGLKSRACSSVQALAAGGVQAGSAGRVCVKINAWGREKRQRREEEGCLWLPCE